MMWSRGTTFADRLEGGKSDNEIKPATMLSFVLEPRVTECKIDTSDKLIRPKYYNEVRTSWDY